MAGKKDRGEGFIFESPKGSGRWFATVYDGRGKPTTRRAASRTAAEAKRQELVRRRDEGLDIGGGSQTLRAFISTWWERSTKDRGLAPKTLEDYRATIERYILPEWGRFRLEDFERDATLVLEIHKVLREKYSLAIAHRVMGKLSMIFNAAMRWKVMRSNPVADVRQDLPPYAGKEVAPLTLKQTRQLLAYVEQLRLCCLYHVALTLGLRLGELLGLQWGDIDWRERTITIRRQIQEVAGKRQQRDKTKTGAGVRTLPIPPRLYARLVALPRTSLYIFPSDKGTMMSPSVFSRHWRGGVAKRYVKKGGEPGESVIKGVRQKAGMPETLTPHHFRHTVSTRLMEQGTPDAIRDAIMGHGKKRDARNIYSHATLDTMRRALEEYERILWGDIGEIGQTGT